MPEARQEMSRLQAQVKAEGISQDVADALRDELRALRNRNLGGSFFRGEG